MISRATLSGVVAGQQKFRSMLAGNSAFFPTSFESIATVSGTGSSNSIVFSSIPNTYKHLQIRYTASIDYGSLNNSTVVIYFNGDTTYANYYSHNLRGDGDFVSVGDGAFPRIAYALDSTIPATIMTGSIIDIHDYAETNKNKVARATAGFNTNGSSGSTERIGLYSALWLNTAAITSVQITGLDGSWSANSRFALYGIKG